MTDDPMPHERCIRNERTLDRHTQMLQDIGDRMLKTEIRQDRIIKNELGHVWTKSRKDVAIWLSPSIIVAIISNLDKIADFIQYLKTLLGGI